MNEQARRKVGGEKSIGRDSSNLSAAYGGELSAWLLLSSLPALLFIQEQTGSEARLKADTERPYVVGYGVKWCRCAGSASPKGCDTASHAPVHYDADSRAPRSAL